MKTESVATKSKVFNTIDCYRVKTQKLKLQLVPLITKPLSTTFVTKHHEDSRCLHKHLPVTRIHSGIT